MVQMRNGHEILRLWQCDIPNAHPAQSFSSQLLPKCPVQQNTIFVRATLGS